MNIYVGNLSWGLSDSDLEQVFAEYGPVKSAKIIQDRETGRSRGFGFVEMANEDDGRKAIDAVNGMEIDGRSLTVNEARPREERPPRRDNDRGGRGGDRNDRW
ncbi:MAG TPA: RNA-binding protein [Verrucomicrobiales bacterium]|jgi:RNA recognition motif-containing protein|nr:RNA-binding protein [Verrucomicrobiales bacterium]|tara:strand:+ start:381 stop:689 length:309 start_codon:yes stop_codon:yes gene_type:complete